MSLEVINTFGTIATVAIVAATAVAALIQLRHMRAGNQINAMLDIGDRLSTREFTDAAATVRRDLDRAMRDPAYRDFELALSLGHHTTDVDPAFVELRRATILVGNAYEELGILVKRGIVDKDMFLDRYCWLIVSAWERLSPLTAFAREATSPLAWENFEYIAVLSEDWIKQHEDGAYPHGMRRMQLTNPWPLAAAAKP
jgi:hypothetical protein